MKSHMLRILLIILLGVAGAVCWGLLKSDSKREVDPDPVPIAARDTGADSRSDEGVNEAIGETALPQPAVELDREPVELPKSARSRGHLSITGRVVDGQGNDVPDAIVSASSSAYGVRHAPSDQSGLFEVTGLTAGSYHLSASKDHYKTAVAQDVPAGSSGIELVLEDLSSVEGRVIDASTGEPLPVFDVAVLDRAPASPDLWRRAVQGVSVTWVHVEDEGGLFRLDEVLSGEEIAVAARAADHMPAYVSVAAIPPGETSPEIEIALADEMRVEGKVVDGMARPVPGASVYEGDEPRGEVVAATDEEGLFSFVPLETGHMILTATHPEHLPGSTDVLVGSEEIVRPTITLGLGGSVEGVVLRGSQPAAGQKVSVSRGGAYGARLEAWTDSDGWYTIPGVPPGEVHVFASLAQDLTGSAGTAARKMNRLAMVEPGRATEVDFIFPAGAYGRVEGFVTLAEGVPVKAEIQGSVAGPQGEASFQAQAGPDGWYEADDVLPGNVSLRVEVQSSPGAPRRKVVDFVLGEGQTVRQDIAFGAPGTVRGTVKGVRAGERVFLFALAGTVAIGEVTKQDFIYFDRIQAAQAQATEDGFFLLEGLEAGAYTILAVAVPKTASGAQAFAALRGVSQGVTIQAGTEESLELQL